MPTPDAPATTPGPAARVLPEADLAALLRELAEQHGIVGAGVAVDVGGSIAAAATGVASVRTGQPVTPATLFQMGSITKVYTASLVMALADEGVLSVDDPVVRHLPTLRAADRDLDDVTIRHLMSHTGGLPGDVFDDFGRDSDAVGRLVDAVAGLPSEFPTGLIFSYCNTGWSVLGRIAEVLTGTPWYTALHDRLLAPAGLAETLVLPEEVMLHPFAVGHLPDGEGGFEVAPMWSLNAAGGPAGSLSCATPADLTRFARLHLRGGEAADGTRVLAEPTVRAMQQVQVSLPEGAGLADHWGLGWELHDWVQPDGSTVRAIGHDGATIGNNAFMVALPEQDVVVAVGVDGGTAVHRFGTDLVRAVLDRVAGVTAPAWPTAPADPPAIDPASVVGVYARHGTEIAIRQGEDGGFLLDVEPSGILATIQPPIHDMPAVPLADGRLLLSMGPITVPAVVFEAGGDRWLFTGARAARRVRD